MSGRIRTIKPELLEDERTAALSHESWRLFVSLLLVADDYGNFRAHPKQLEGAIFWSRESLAGVSRGLRELVESRLLEVYEVNGQQYGHLRGWAKHQRVDKAGKPRCPGPSDGTIVEQIEDSRESREDVANDSRDSRAAFLPDLRPPTPTPTNDQRPTPRPSVASTVVVPVVKSKTSARGGRLPADWQPSTSTLDAFKAQGVDALATLPEFNDYWIAVPGAKGIKADWDATFRNRVRQLIADGRAPVFVAEPPRPVPLPDLTDEERAANGARLLQLSQILQGANQ